MNTQRKGATHPVSPAGASTPSDPAGASQAKLALPCVEVQITATVMTKNGASSAAKMLKLCRDGASLAMDAKNVRRVFPDGQTRPGTPLRVGFGLPAGRPDQIVKIDALCRILGARRVGTDLLSVDLRFTGFTTNGGNRVEQFILDAMYYEWP